MASTDSMRLLVVPNISTTGEIFRESEFVGWFQFSEQWVKMGHTVVFVIPKQAKIPVECENPNIIYYRSERWFPYYMGRAFVDADILDEFNPINGKLQCDALLTSRTAAAAPLKRLLWACDVLKLPVFLIENWVEKNWKSDLSVDLKMRALSYSEVPTFFPSRREHEFGLDIVRHSMSPSCVLRAKETSITRSHGIRAKLIREVGAATKKFENPTLLFAARFNPNKRWDKVLRMYEDVAISRPDVRVKVVKLGGHFADETTLSYFQKCEILDPLPFAQYAELLNQCWLSISMSLDEGFSFGFAEQISTGNPVLLPNKPWAQDLAGKDWPFLYDSDSEIRPMIDWCLDNYDEARARVADRAEKFAVRHDISTSAQDIMDRVKLDIEASYPKFGEWRPRLEKILDKMPAQFKMKDFTKVAKKEEGLDFGSFALQFSAVGNLRSLYFFLKARCNLVPATDPIFEKR